MFLFFVCSSCQKWRFKGKEVQTERNETGISFTLQNEEFSKFSINLFDERNASFYIERGKNSEQYDIVLEMAAEQNFVSSSFKTKDKKKKKLCISCECLYTCPTHLVILLHYYPEAVLV